VTAAEKLTRMLQLDPARHSVSAGTRPIQPHIVGGNPRAAFTATPATRTRRSGAFSAILSPDELARKTGALYPGLLTLGENGFPDPNYGCR
jgi:hypothetical protein